MSWEPPIGIELIMLAAQPSDEDYMPPSRRLLHAVADRLHWEQALAEARRRARDALAAELSAAQEAA